MEFIILFVFLILFDWEILFIFLVIYSIVITFKYKNLKNDVNLYQNKDEIYNDLVIEEEEEEENNVVLSTKKEKVIVQESHSDLDIEVSSNEGNNESIDYKNNSKDEYITDNSDIQMKTGVALVVLAIIIFATTTWSIMSVGFKIFTIFSTSVSFFLISKFVKEKYNLNKTAITFYNLGSLVLPLTVLSMGYFGLFDSILPLGYKSSYFTQFIMALIFGICSKLGYNIFKINAYITSTLATSFLSVFLLVMFVTEDFKFSLLALILYTTGFITYKIEKKNENLYNLHAISNLCSLFVILSILIDFDNIFFLISTSTLILFILYTVSDIFIKKSYNNDIVKFIYPFIIFILGLCEPNFYLQFIIIIESGLCLAYQYKQSNNVVIPYMLSILSSILFFNQIQTFNINIYTFMLYFFVYFICICILLFRKKEHLPATLLITLLFLRLYGYDFNIDLILTFSMLAIYAISYKNIFAYFAGLIVFNSIPIQILNLANFNLFYDAKVYIYTFIVLGLLNYGLTYILPHKGISRFFSISFTLIGYVTLFLFVNYTTIDLLFILLFAAAFNYMAIKDNLFTVTFVTNFYLTLLIIDHLEYYLNDLNMYILLIFIGFAYMYFGRKIYSKLISIETKSLNIDYLSLLSFIFFQKAYFIHNQYLDFIVTGLMILYFANLFNRQNKFIDYITLFLGGITTINLLVDQPFIVIDRLFELEYTFICILGVLWLVHNIVKKKYNDSLMFLISFSFSTMIIVLLFNVIFGNEFFDLCFLFINMIIMFIIANNNESKFWSKFSLAIICILIFYETYDFWTSIAWWIYLLFAGLTLIVISANKEKNRK
ncbi:MAG: hypothetical protein R3Y13_00935 [bacterium]